MLRSTRPTAAAFAAILSATAPAFAGCPFSAVIANLSNGTPDGGGFDFSATPYAGKPSPGPEIRFWAHGHFAEANSGAQKQHHPGILSWLENIDVDWKVKDGNPNLFSVTQANWMGGQVVGCLLNMESIPVEKRRTVVEISFADDGKEGTGEHRGYYAVSSAPWDLSTSAFNLDLVRGGSGKNGNVVPVVPIPAPRVTAGAEPAGASHLKVSLELPAVASYSEGGKDQPLALVKGYRVLYAMGKEPTTSAPDSYKPALDAAAAKEAGVLAPGKAVIAVPKAEAVWLVAQLVYDDPQLLTSRATSAHVSALEASVTAAGAGRGRTGSSERSR